jgi:amylosucrase
MHRHFLIDYFTGKIADSDARGLSFGHNKSNDDARISGTLTSLIGLESALEAHDDRKIEFIIQQILLLYSIIFSFGGVPLIYYGDEIGNLNDYSYISVLGKANDSRWSHRPKIDWEKAERRHQPGTIEYKIFHSLRHMISVRREIPEFQDFNNRQLLDVSDPHLFSFLRVHRYRQTCVLVVANFDANPHYLDLDEIEIFHRKELETFIDLYSNTSPLVFNGRLVLPPYRFYWLTESL